jgi:hypothetical protein
MTKVSQSFYSTAIEHKEVSGCFMASFATPGETAMWVHDSNTGKPKLFRTAVEAELAGFRVMASRLNRARDVQTFQTKGYKEKGGIRSFRTEDSRNTEPTVERVFGKR